MIQKTCVRCHQPLDVHTKMCSECLHYMRMRKYSEKGKYDIIIAIEEGDKNEFN